ncbi:ATP-binding protein [Pseudonocardia oroxyli]|uniref:Anti-sigma regulatory factor (Ser/Thr protein kinase) n=1 Tax=Pseudonocardia oroxyli TaxID=366584 RepID=A0A1G8DJY2_PSEOR|nr:ATP-binding protein [Pseudonocardia oroxyli]SDH57988.1 Anti-sigma regulatory factor (Ser/Thr protein kinase) [Pseudonocardia oroxyli]
MADDAGYYSIRFGADPVQLAFFRAGLDRWLQGLSWPEEARVDAILAVSEACTNAVKHAYVGGVPGDVEVVGRLVAGPSSRQIVVTVRDEGVWRPDQGATGYGMSVMNGCMDRVSIRRDDAGTTVTLRSVPVPLPHSSPEGMAAVE